MGPRAAVACAVAGLALILAACGGQTPAGGPQSGSRTVTIYSSLPQYGPERERSQDMVNAIKLAIQQSGGKAGALAVTYVALDSSTREDGTWTSGRVLDNARQAVRDPNAIAYIGDRESAATALSLPLTNEGGILQVSPTSAYDGLTRAGGVRTGEPERFYPSGMRTFGRMVPPDHVQASALVGYMKSEGVHRLALLGDRDLDGGGLADQVSSAAAAQGIAVVDKGRIDATRGNLAGTAADVAATGADAFIFAGEGGSGAARIFAAVAAAAPQMLLFAPAAVAEPDFLDALAPDVQQRVRITTPTLPPRLLPPSARAFRARFRSTFGRAPAPEALLAYEATEAVLASIRAAGAKGNDRSAVIRAFFAIRNRHSVLGTYSIDRNGDTSLSRFAGNRLRHSRLVLDKVLEVRP
ncbi:MAG: branched-chain amino acid transport system substrate-binding protein [Solirubrobacteraceae bacterium]|nr:branched-chain amino acid transport system substrate-binding protein [Solirubrobacteraceae bacterium]